MNYEHCTVYTLFDFNKKIPLTLNGKREGFICNETVSR